MKKFDIRDHVEFDAKGRAECPSCLQDGKTGKNLSVTLSGEHEGAYKCFRGCTSNQIREAIGAKRPTTIAPPATAPAPPPKSVVLSPQKVKAATEKLLTQSTHGLKWLNDRGITTEMIEHYRLGVVRAKVGDSTRGNGFTHLPAIAISIPNHDRTSYFHKKRVRPWVPKDQQPDGYQAWSQYGIPAMAFITHSPGGGTADHHPQQTWLCEGEWDAITLGWAVKHHPELSKNTMVACFTCGAGNFNEQCRLPLLGTITTFYDRDAPGAKGAQKFQQQYPNITRIATVPGPQDAPKGWDVSDALNGGYDIDAFIDAAKKAIAYEAVKKENPLRDRLVINDDMLARAPDYTDWLVDDLLTADELFLLAASPRAGKSLLALTLTHAVAHGGKFLGRPVSQGAVIYIRCEDSDTKTKERELKQGWGEGLAVYWLDKFKLSELEQLEILVEELDVRLVVFDTLSRVRDASVSESSAEMSQLLEPVQEMCKRQRCCGLLVHHTGKISTDNAGTINVYDTIRGSSAIRATCRGTLILAADERNYRLHVENGWGKHDLQVSLDAHTLTWKLLGNWVGPNVDFSQKDRVLAYLTQVGRATIDNIAEGTNLPKRSLYEVLKRLQADDMIEKHGERTSAVYVRHSIQQLDISDAQNDHPLESATEPPTEQERFGRTALKPIQQIQHVESLLNRSNVDREKNITSFNNIQREGGEDEKVISHGEGIKEHEVMGDHFLQEKVPPTPGEVLNRTPEPITDKGLRIQQQFNTDSTRISGDGCEPCESKDLAIQQGVRPPSVNSTAIERNSTAIERWMIHTEYDTVVEVIKPGKKASEVKISGIGLRRVDNALLQPCDYDGEA